MVNAANSRTAGYPEVEAFCPSRRFALRRGSSFLRFWQGIARRGTNGAGGFVAVVGDLWTVDML